MNEVMNDTSMDNVTPEQDKKLKEYTDERSDDSEESTNDSDNNRVTSPVAGVVLEG